ncbi:MULTISPECIES: hypothetical protein [unclassified Tolypothrix]|uniref:hypothetical protein n=1 Tax=unclassified Tolypothrix TaxID=2649714 RepID=UPI0005EABA89|nr:MULTISPECIES: hypothetical protein [unclassified Tolypothrix]BAY95503.1 hypothetical protein NIES3275_75600 [Microchaete diplosiphon NIES-3275]EKE97251.1 hypothetical protein FDUTEX481_05272 [Tolypothrix sp. PCC 7601]MBE9084887.1 hypothetical protein [Tolypothrix sp. LEGE 11397]UYD30595.1 hypothetical protein HGR01_37880 [Tolypothrix sp. PCC 7712]UYD38477.1 hypothetical protein HG267_38965 [Tolypothrix sp. PCC 7601]
MALRKAQAFPKLPAVSACSSARSKYGFLGATAQAALPPAMNERNYFEATNERVH